MRRPRYVIYAVLFFVYEQYAFQQWMAQNGSIGAALSHAWDTLQRDPMVFMAWNDMAVFTAVVLVWLWRDLKASGRSKAWWPATLLMGCPALLVYLARRPESDASPRVATS